MEPTTIASSNIASHLSEMARRAPGAIALAFPAGRDGRGGLRHLRRTFRDLEDESIAIARGFREIGIGPGTRTALLVKPSIELFQIVFGLFKAGAVMVCVDPGLGLGNIGRCLARAEPQAFIGAPLAHAARRLLGWGRGTVRVNVIAPRTGASGALLGGGISLAEVARLGERSSGDPATETRTGDPAAILFTSGSTGPPKGVVYSHANFNAQVDALRTAYDIRPGEVDLETFPLFALFAPALGMTAVIPEMDFTRPGRADPRKIAEAVEAFGVTNLFGSPALLDRLGRWGIARGARLPTLKRVISAGAPVDARIVERMSRLLPPEAEVHTPYGATEALPVTTIGSREILGATRGLTEAGRGVCVGRPAGDVRVRVIRIRDEPIPRWSGDLEAGPGEVGEVTVQGPVVTASYHGLPEATALAKIADPGRDSPWGFWHRMGDLGYLDERGRLWFCGRKSQRVSTPRGDLFTAPCEGIFNAHPEVRRTALVGARRGGSIRPALVVEIEPGAPADRERLRRELLELAARHETTRGIEDVFFRRTFPVDVRHNAKIGREELARWAAGRLR